MYSKIIQRIPITRAGVVLVLVLVLVLAHAIVAISYTNASQDIPDDNALKQAKAQARGMALAFHAASAKMMPSVVKVLATREDVDPTLEELDLLDKNSSKDYEIGSGVILSEDGLCVTNHHVISKAKGIVVYLPDGRKLVGNDVRSDKKSDIAIFQVRSPDPLPAATMGDSDALMIGDWVIAIGSPFSLDQTVSVGIISSKGRSMSLLSGQLLQTDAVINPGNSGGALLDINGDLVGINTAIASTSGQFQGVGFAIPARRVQWIIKELISNGKVRRSLFGVQAFSIPQGIASDLKISVRSGVYIGKVVTDGPAEKGGILVGDIVQAIGDQKVINPDDFKSIVEQLPADRSYSVKILRDGMPMTLDIQPITTKE
ncbi:MAG: trypsin-like peptidase domain-containing protein [Pirellula sp.]